MADTTGQIWGRRARLTVALPSGSFSDTDPLLNAVVMEGDDAGQLTLRIVFKITKTLGKKPNTSEITVHNAAPETRAALTKLGKGAQVLLETGYQDTGLVRLFAGDVRTVDHIRDVADWKTVLKCGDGERAFRFARASESFAGGCTVGDVVKFCAKSMGLALGNTVEQAAKLTTKLAHGWTVDGAASTELDRIVRAVGYGVSIQDGQIQILAPGASRAQTIPEANRDTGLVGSPEMATPEKKGKPASMKFKTMLLPQSLPGGRVHVKSERYDGVYRTQKVEHTGDTRGAEWHSSFESTLDPTVRVA